MTHKKNPLAKMALARFIETRARKKNEELGFVYYSENPEEYEYGGVYEDKQDCVFYFTCPQNHSTITVSLRKL